MTYLVPAWEPCECCDDYVCNIHIGHHVHDCSCPGINEWVEHGVFPYADCLDPDGRIINDAGIVVHIDTTSSCNNKLAVID